MIKHINSYRTNNFMYKMQKGNLGKSLEKLKNCVIEEERINNYGYLPIEIRNSIEDKIKSLQEKAATINPTTAKKLQGVLDRAAFPGNDTAAMYIALGKVEKALAES